MVIQDVLARQMRFMDAEVQYTPDILKIIKKQDWMGFDTNKRPLFVNELKGLTPFSMVDLTEDEIADLMAADNALNKATMMTITDYKAKSPSIAKIQHWQKNSWQC